MPNKNKIPKPQKVLDRERYVPFHLSNLANGLSRSASRLYLALFGIGVIEWRILSILSIESNVTANHICRSIELDRAAVSRSLRVLERQKLATTARDARDSRKRPIKLTRKGKLLHDRILDIALERQRRLLQGLSTRQIDHLLKTLRYLSENAEDVYNYDASLMDRYGCYTPDK